MPATILSTPCVGNTLAITLNAYKDGAIWDLTGATVKLQLTRPDATSFQRNASVTNAAGGVATYTTTTSDLNVPGNWSYKWWIVSGAVSLVSVPISLSVDEGL